MTDSTTGAGRITDAMLDDETAVAAIPARKPRTRAKTAARKAQDAILDAADKVVDAADTAHAAATDAIEHASDAYDDARLTVRQVRSHVEPFVDERPYAALGIAVGVGFVLGMLFGARRPKVIYVPSSR